MPPKEVKKKLTKKERKALEEEKKRLQAEEEERNRIRLEKEEAESNS